MTLSGLIACKVIPERLGMRRLDGDDFSSVSPAQLTAPRMAACGLATMLLSLWGFVVGTIVGWQAAGTLMGLSTNIFFHMFYLMIWYRDVVGMIVKGLCFGLLTGAICSFESLRAGQRPMDEGDNGTSGGAGTASADLAFPIVRAACLSMIAILILNMAWFILVYHAVPVYGPSLLQPPSQ
jgi:phospholipid/cholesterol/gamma-HCH transport system permease protein